MRSSSELTLWPNHLKPLQDELASSWLVRLAHAHGYKSEQLCRILLGRARPMWNRDVDRQLSEELREALRNVTAISAEQLDLLGLTAYQGIVSEQVNANGNSRWILPLGVWHRKRRMSSLMCCPMCLATDAVPYFRRSWRLSFVTVCTKHHVDLIDECPACCSPITPHRVDVGKVGLIPRKNTLVKCASCGYDLRSVVPTKAESKLAAFTRTLNQAVAVGHVDWAGRPGMHSVLFFNGLRSVIKVVLNRDLWTLPIGTEFERHPIATRRRAMQIAASIFNGTPQPLLQFAYRVKARYVDFVDDPRLCPYWLLTQLSGLQRSQHPRRSAVEIAAIADAVERKAGRASPNRARREFGVNLSGPGHSRFRSQVSDEAFEWLVASVDHSISRAHDPSAKLALIQDKVMFGLIRAVGWGSSRLCRVGLDEVEASLPLCGFARGESLWFDAGPLAADCAAARVWWFLNEMRPRIPNSAACGRVFLNTTSGLPLSESAIGARFTKAVRIANLTASIRDMHALKRMP
ncbi:TniQ family protein [Acidovorax sp. NPDC077693]